MDWGLFWNVSTEDLKKGFSFSEQGNGYTCIFCGEAFECGRIYPMERMFYDAQKAAEIHVKTQHQPIFDFYLSMGRIYTGLSNNQTELTKLFYGGHSDKEIAALTGANSTSTIRNQRFSIREKYKQAKILVALVELLEERLEQLKQEGKAILNDEKLVNFHHAAQSVDERYAITQIEKEEVLNRYFGTDNQLLIKQFPAREKKKIIILQKIMNDFELGRQYTEKEVNNTLKQYYDDFVSVRRSLIEYGFMDRSGDGVRYWVKLQ